MTARTLFLGFVSTIALVSACNGGGGEPALYDIQPRAGRTEGSQTIRITGHAFRSDISYAVYFGPKKAERVSLADPQTLLVLTPQVDQPGPVDIYVRADDGHAWKIEQGFRFEGAPAAGSTGEGPGPTKNTF